MFLLHLVKTVESPAVESNAHIYLSTSRFRLHSVSVAGFQGKKRMMSNVVLLLYIYLTAIATLTHRNLESRQILDVINLARSDDVF